MHEESPSPEGPVLKNRWPEAVVSAGLVGVSALVISDSLRVGNGWADDGPEAGYFPFYIGLLLLASSLSVLLRTLWQWRQDSGVFADLAQLRSVAAVLVPMALYVGAIHVIGIYAASLLLIAYFMRRHGRYGPVPTLLVSAGVPLVVYLVFERWFLVLLPKSLWSAQLGF